MNSELVQSADNRATVRVSLDAKEVNRIFHDVYNYYSRKLKIPGFRKGKIPPKIILGRVGEEEIREQVRDNIKAQAVQKSVDELKLDIRSQKVVFTE